MSPHRIFMASISVGTENLAKFPNFATDCLTGTSSGFNYLPTYASHHIIPSDFEALHRDWTAVGNVMEASFEHFNITPARITGARTSGEGRR